MRNNSLVTRLLHISTLLLIIFRGWVGDMKAKAD